MLQLDCLRLQGCYWAALSSLSATAIDAPQAPQQQQQQQQQQVLVHVLEGEIALQEHNLESARDCFQSALELEPQCPDALVRLSFLSLSGDGVRYDSEGFMNPSLRSLRQPSDCLDHLHNLPVDDFRSHPTISFSWLLLVEGLTCSALVLERLGRYEEALDTFSDVWRNFIYPQIELSSLELDGPNLELLRTRIYSVGLAALTGLARLFIRIGQCSTSIETFRSVCTDEKVCSQAPRFRAGCFFRFAQLLLCHNMTLSDVFNSSNGGSVAAPSEGCSSPIDEALLLLRILFATTDASFSPLIGSSLRRRAQRTLQLALVISGHFHHIVELSRNVICTSLSSSDGWYTLSLALRSVRDDMEAFLAVEHVLEIEPENVSALLLGSRISLNSLSDAAAAVEFAVKAAEALQIQLDDKNISPPPPPLPHSAHNPINDANVKGHHRRLKSASVSGSAAEKRKFASDVSAFLSNLHRPSLFKCNTAVLGSEFMHAQCAFAVGVACSRRAYEIWSFSQRKALQERALFCLRRAAKLQPRRRDIIFHLSVIHADIREVHAALRLARYALNLDNTNVYSWQLIALLHSAKKDFVRALKACDTGLAECPASQAPLLLLVKARIAMEKAMTASAESQSRKADVELTLLFFRVLLESLFGSAMLIEKVNEWKLPNFGRKMRKPSQATITEHTTRTQAELKFYTSNSLKRDDPDWIKYESLLSLSLFYTFVADNFQLPDAISLAFNCVDFARDLGSSCWLPDIYAMLAMLCEGSGDLELAVKHYETALAFDANHTETLTRMGSVQNRRRRQVIAHEYLAAALNIDSTLHQTWYEMGLVLQKQGRHVQASDALLTALELERTVPAMSFYAIPRTL